MNIEYACRGSLLALNPIYFLSTFNQRMTRPVQGDGVFDHDPLQISGYAHDAGMFCRLISVSPCWVGLGMVK